MLWPDIPFNTWHSDVQGLGSSKKALSWGKMLSLNNQEGDSWDISFDKASYSWWIRSAFEKGTLLHTLLWTRSSWHRKRGVCTNNPLIWYGGGRLWHLCFKGYQWQRSKARLCKKLGTQPTSSSSIASLEASLSVLLWVWTYIRSSQLNQWGNTNGHFIFIQLTRGSQWRASWDGMPEKPLEAELSQRKLILLPAMWLLNTGWLPSVER